MGEVNEFKYVYSKKSNEMKSIPEGNYSALLVSVDGKTEREVGGLYHITLDSPKYQAKHLGRLCQEDVSNISLFDEQLDLNLCVLRSRKR